MKKTPEQMLMMPKDTFRRLINKTLWQEEYERRSTISRASSRLQLIADELSQLRTRDQRAISSAIAGQGHHIYSLYSVDNQFHARLLAMTRSGILPIEIKTVRWQGLARDQRRCSLGCDHVGDTEHFLYGCTQ